jgi:hypothetical protein
MEHVSTNLLFEILGYYPVSFFPLEITNRKLSETLHKRLDALQTLIEEVYRHGVRDKDIDECKRFLKSRIKGVKFFAGA